MARARRVGLGHEGMSTPAEGLCHRSDLFSNRPFLIVFQFAELDPRLVVGHPDDRAPQGDRAGVPLEYKGKIYLRTAGFDTRPVDTTAPQAEIREGLVQRDMRAKTSARAGIGCRSWDRESFAIHFTIASSAGRLDDVSRVTHPRANLARGARRSDEHPREIM